MPDDVLYVRPTCQALVITCSDFRFKRVEGAFVDAAGLTDDYDLIARPGAIRSLVAPRSSAARETMEDEITLLWKLHRFTRVLMVNHMSCRAYDDLATGDGARELHVAHLSEAGPAMGRLIDGASAEPYLISLVDGELRVENLNAR